MAVNHKSGRLVVDIDPALKRDLHAALAADGSSLKEWVVRNAQQYLAARTQPDLFRSRPHSHRSHQEQE